MIYLRLAWAFFQIGLFSVGGGYAAMPLIQNQVVTLNHWLTLSQFADVVTISEMTPGPIALNAATFVGTQVAGIWGAVFATIGCILPSCVIVSLLAMLYRKYGNLGAMQEMLGVLRPAVVGMIASAGVTLFMLAVFGGTSPVSFDLPALVLCIGAFLILRSKKISPIALLALCGVLGVAVYGLMGL